MAASGKTYCPCHTKASLFCYLYTNHVFMRMVVSWCTLDCPFQHLNLINKLQQTHTTFHFWPIYHMNKKPYLLCFIVALAMMLGDSHSELCRLLNSIPSITVAMVNLEFKEQVLPPTCQAVRMDYQKIILHISHLAAYCMAYII